MRRTIEGLGRIDAAGLMLLAPCRGAPPGAAGLRITLIEPGAVDTALNDRITDEKAKEASHVAITEIFVRLADQATP